MNAPPKSSAGVEPGQVLAGKYRIERVLGAGGMGVVVAAHHIQLDERVALKFLLPEALLNPESVARFAREARAAVKIKSEHVARVTDVGQLENGAPYMVMEYLDGSDLATWLQDRGRLPVDQAVDFILQACEALADAHSLGIVHRDLKPANLFCIRRSDGQAAIKVLDFGISKLTSSSALVPDMTRTSTIMGSPYYMSPEQMRASKDVDARSDIWALGVILFELIAGEAPFTAETVTDLAIKIATVAARPVRSLRPDVSPQLEQVLAKCLEKDRAQRYQNVSELALALKDFGSRRAAASVERIQGTLEHARLAPASSGQIAGAAVVHPGTLASFGKTGPGGRSSGKVIAGVLAMAAAVLLVGGGLVLARRGASPAAPAPSVAAVSMIAPEPHPSVVPIAPAPAPSPPPTEPVVTASATASVGSPPAASPPHSPSKPRNPPIAPPSKPASSSVAKPNCNPAYVIDSAGHRQYKPECL
jgi:hypothetical protein